MQISIDSSRILMLVPHEPEKDPRIKWVTGLCSQIGRTDVLGFTFTNEKPSREYDGIVYTERIKVDLFSSRLKLSAYHFLNIIQLCSIRLSKIVRFLKRSRRKNERFGLKSNLMTISSSPFSENLENKQRLKLLSLVGKTISRITKLIISVPRFLFMFSSYYFIADALYRHARAISIIPRVIICHDIQALAAGVRIRQLHKCPIIYDSHELWPEANLGVEKWEKKITSFIERRLIRYADIVVTVTPQIAGYLEWLYGISGVLIAENAEPFSHSIIPSCYRPSFLPIKFLFQGRITANRGIEEFLDLWSRLNDDRAILILRSPESNYYSCIKDRFHEEIKVGRIIISPPVDESELVAIASLADVGVIPYGGPSLNHIYASPNKLSQYMQAGLAILCNTDLEFVCNIIGRFECGLTYSVDKPENFIAAIQYFLGNPQRVHLMKKNAYKAAQSEFNWEVKSKDYYQAISRLYHHTK